MLSIPFIYVVLVVGQDPGRTEKFEDKILEIAILFIFNSTNQQVMQKVYRNSAILILFVMIGVQWGFYKPYSSEFPNFVNKTIIIHIHGALLMSWLVLLIVQPLLIHTGKSKLHINIGKVSYVLGPLIIIFMFLVGKGGYWRSIGVVSEHENFTFMALDIRGLLSFATFWTLAMYFRKNSDAHMRYMIATGILCIGPGVGRGLTYSFDLGLGSAITITDILDLVIVGFLLGYDIYRKKKYKPFLIVFIVFLIGTILWQLRDSAAWQSFAKYYAAYFY